MRKSLFHLDIVTTIILWALNNSIQLIAMNVNVVTCINIVLLTGAKHECKGERSHCHVIISSASIEYLELQRVFLRQEY